ncbi:Portal protein [Janthinobacterium sp. CG23_2]|nr:Portal protein [Janthinobacterium sp. CG23_2]CUU33225.1 Portal protein [Janthinobacterium sp. CG23_2]
MFDQDIRIERVANSLSVVPDAYCMDADSANWDNAFVEDSYSLDAFKAKWPKAETDSFEGDGKDVAKAGGMARKCALPSGGRAARCRLSCSS